MMNREEEIERIRELILRAIYSGLTGEEREELACWRGQTPRNEELYRKLLEQRFTPGEYERYEQARSGDDWEQLRAKWRTSRRRRYLSWQWMARYAAVIVLGVVLAYWFRQPEKPQRPMVVRRAGRAVGQPGNYRAGQPSPLCGAGYPTGGAPRVAGTPGRGVCLGLGRRDEGVAECRNGVALPESLRGGGTTGACRGGSLFPGDEERFLSLYRGGWGSCRTSDGNRIQRDGLCRA